MDIRRILANALIENELGGHLNVAFKFSDPDGVRTGKSGWSFGRCQYDLQNNPTARKCLEEAGFSNEEIVGLIKQEIGPSGMRALNDRMANRAVQDVIDKYDNLQLDELISHTRAVIGNAGLALADAECFIHLADYHNQFFINYGGKCVAWLQRLGRTVTSEDVRAYKLQTAWGLKRPDDVNRRWNHIHRLCAAAVPA